MDTEQILSRSHDKNLAVTWDDAHRYTPPTRHRRRLILQAIAGLDFRDCLDAGCAQPYLLQEIVSRHGAAGYGCDISDQVMVTNRERFPDLQFEALDLSRETWPGGRQFDLVVCSEVLEHIVDWQAAVANLVRMTRKHLLITVPGGKLRLVEKMLGHYRHYQGPELVAALEAQGCTDIRLRHWGFPFSTLYRVLVNRISPDKLYTAFCSEQKYSLGKKMVAHGVNALFYLNGFVNAGPQLIALAKPPRQPPRGEGSGS